MSIEGTGSFKNYQVKCYYCGKDLIRNIKLKKYVCARCREINIHKKNKERKKAGGKNGRVHSAP